MTSPPAPSDSDYKYVVLGPEGVPVARVITARAQCPALDGRRREHRDDRPHAGGDDPGASVAQRPSAAEAVGVSRHDVRGDDPANRGTRERRWRLAAVAEGRTEARRDPRRYRVPHRLRFRHLPVVRRPVAWPFERVANAAAAAQPDLVIHVGDYPLPRRPLRPRASRLLRQPVGLRLRRMATPTCSSLRASSSPRHRGS